jgi:serine/threonine protein kinase/DNA-binding winged helix-turn-helix (wHTH) protein/tetratricopeptide (TPR) repeat protein
MNLPQPNRVRFGSFELDFRSGELRPLEPVTGMRTIVLQEQPFQVLRLLIERNGEVATREEIRKNLWPNDTAVDFNHSINVAIGTLRRVLRDSAEDPKYIETVARRGYRLIAPTEWVTTADELSSNEAGPRNDDGGNGTVIRPTTWEGGGLIGRKVLHYRVLEVIGGGGMGLVFKAEDLKLSRRVALKFLPEELTSDPLSLRRFAREAQTASSLNHANICTIHAIEEYEGLPFIVMELLEGETLRDRLAASSAGTKAEPLLLDEALEISAQICSGLEAAHRKGIIHRDIKPANIFLTRQGAVKILDFGLAKLAATDDQEKEEDQGHSKGQTHPTPQLGAPSQQKSSTAIQEADASLTRTGMAIGTAGYMSPEQIRKERLDARTDLFSFGLVLYEMVTGLRPFTGHTAEAVHDAILHQAPVPAHNLNAAIPAGLDAIIARALEKDRAQRYQFAADMAADMAAIQRGKHRRPRYLWKGLAAAALLFIVVAGSWTWRRVRHAFTLSAQDTVVLADVDNTTSDPTFDDALNTALRVGFEQTPFLNLLAPDKVRGTLQLLHRPEDARLTPERAREVCLRTHSKAVIASSIADAGNHFALELDGIDCATGRTIANVTRDVGGRSEIVRTLGAMAVEVRRKLGESPESLQKFSQPLDRATSSSLEALQLLAQGYKHHSARDEVATSYYQRAIELDPNFALAYVALGARYSNVGEMELASAAEKKAYELRDRLTGTTGFIVETLYYDLGTGELEKAYPIHEQWVQTFPLDPRAHINFSFLLQQLGQYERAVIESRESVRLLPSVATYANLVTTTILANRLDEAKAAYDEAEAHGTIDSSLHSLRHLVAFLQQDKPAMREQLAWAMAHPDLGSPVFKGEANAQEYYGHFRMGTHWLRRQTDAARANPEAGVTVDDADFALQEAEAGSLTNARKLVSGPNHGPLDRDTQLELALLSARSGNIERARQLSDAISQEFPLDTLTQNYSLPTIRAAIQLQQNDPAGAIETLRPALKYDLAYPNPFNDLYPAYLRGLAYLRMNNGRLAAQEFQKLMDHPAIIGRFVTGSLARLQLARAEAMAGDQVTARKSYQEFLLLWQEADPDIPIYRQAKEEYKRLN